MLKANAMTYEKASELHSIDRRMGLTFFIKRRSLGDRHNKEKGTNPSGSTGKSPRSVIKLDPSTLWCGQWEMTFSLYFREGEEERWNLRSKGDWGLSARRSTVKRNNGAVCGLHR